MPEALVVRTGTLFDADDHASPLARALEALRSGDDAVVPVAVRSFTFVPDLVNVVLDLLLDGERGVWHLVTAGGLSWLDLARRAAALAGLNGARLREEAPEEAGAAQGGAALDSERERLLPPLEDALVRYLRDTAGQLACARVAGVAARPAAGA